ncbi:MAG: hypothetical protein WCC57_04815 [Paracoccaceae bacterium]
MARPSPLLTSILPAMALALVLPVAATGQTIDLLFEPPPVPSEQVCITRAPDEDLVQTWQTWDGKSLPDLAPELVKRDLRRLMELDPQHWQETITKALALMPSIDPGYDDDKATFDRVELLIATGQLRELTNLRLVPQLLASDLAKAPRGQNALSKYLMRGIGIKQDTAAGLALLVQAGYGGNADALLELASMQIAGKTVPGWDVTPDLAVTMAFGALVGQLDPMICDRVTRIAREYANGEIVTRDIGLSERWFRFSADLGDAVAAWKVAEMHMRSEDLTKDNATLVTYLTKAAEGGLSYAEVTLGRAFELGAIVPQDTSRAAELYRRSAEFGDRAGTMRNALFLQARAKADPTQTGAYFAALDALVQTPDAPAWAFVAQADRILALKGRWSGEAEAIELLIKAKAMGDGSAIQRLASIRYRTATTPADFYRTVDDMIYTVHGLGTIDPMADLQTAFTCRSPAAPQIQEALYWREVENATATKTASFDPADLERMAQTKDPLAEARLQTQAIYGRPSALAQYISLIQQGDYPPTALPFWEAYAQRFENVLQAQGSLALKSAQTEPEREAALRFFRAALAKGEIAAGVDLATALLENPALPPALRAEALAALLPLAEKGNGLAMEMLPRADPDRFPTLQAVFDTYAPAIDARGDFDALLLALPFLTDPAMRADYIARATTITACNFDQSIKFTNALGASGDTAGFQKWFAISDFLSEKDGWRMAQLGDALNKHGTEADFDRSLALYTAANKAGDRSATHRLLNIYGRSTARTYDPAKAAQLYVDLVNFSTPQQLPPVLDRLRTAEPAIQTVAYRSIDETALYLTAAKAGNPVAMREYALIIRKNAQSPAEVDESTDWLERAAQTGDVEAMVAYADALAFGLGTAVSREDALVWLQKAASLGSEDARLKVKTLTLSTKVSQ